MSIGIENTILAFVVVAALALAVQTIGMIALLLVARKAAKNLRDELEHYRSSVSPLIIRARDVMQNVAPKVEQAAGELADITAKLREQTMDVQAAANDIITRTQRQVGRVDSMLSTVFDRVERAGVFMSDAVGRPMRQLSGIIASVRAAVDTMREPPTVNQRPPQSTYRYPDTKPADAPRPPDSPRQADIPRPADIPRQADIPRPADIPRQDVPRQDVPRQADTGAPTRP